MAKKFTEREKLMKVLARMQAEIEGKPETEKNSYLRIYREIEVKAEAIYGRRTIGNFAGAKATAEQHKDFADAMFQSMLTFRRIKASHETRIAALKAQEPANEKEIAFETSVIASADKNIEFYRFAEDTIREIAIY